MPQQAPAAVSKQEKRVDLVLEGGGVKGIGILGALAVLEEEGYRPQNIAGTSAGAIVAVLIAAGYSATELFHVLRNDLNIETLLDTGWEDHVAIVAPALSVFLDQGIYEGKVFQETIARLLKDKGVITFADLVRHEDQGDPLYGYKAQVIASDVTDRDLLVLPKDAGKLGVSRDNLNVALAVRMSMSIPFFFEPVRFHDPTTGREHLIVDGGMLSNYPVWLFDADAADTPTWPTFSLFLVEPTPKVSIGARLPPRSPHGVSVLVDYIRSLAQTMLEAHDRLYMEQETFVRTIPIPTLGVRTTEFDLSDERAQQLFDAGRQAAEEFLATWDFPAYVEQFRQGQVHRRRDAVVKELNAAADTHDTRPAGLHDDAQHG